MGQTITDQNRPEVTASIPTLDPNHFRSRPGEAFSLAMSKPDYPAGLAGYLTESDLERLLTTHTSHPAPSLVKLRESHHMAARLLAQGHRIPDVAYATGYSSGTIQRLQDDPAFQELLAHYRTKVGPAFDYVTEKIAALRDLAVGTLHERLVMEPERFKNNELIKLSGTMLDRTGHGPTSTIENRNLFLSGTELLNLKEIAEKRRKGEVIVTTASSNQGAKVGSSRAGTTLSEDEEKEEIKRKIFSWASLPAPSGPLPSEKRLESKAESVVQFPGQERNGVRTDGSIHSAPPSKVDTPDRDQTESDRHGVQPNE